VRLDRRPPAVESVRPVGESLYGSIALAPAGFRVYTASHDNRRVIRPARFGVALRREFSEASAARVRSAVANQPARRPRAVLRNHPRRSVRACGRDQRERERGVQDGASVLPGDVATHAFQ